MSDSLESLRRQLGSAADLKSVVRAMKALAATSLGQYERSVVALRDYYHTVELGLIAGGRAQPGAMAPAAHAGRGGMGVVILGSDQGLVGQFNESIAEFLKERLTPAPRTQVWAIGERVAAAVAESEFTEIRTFELPNSIQAIDPLVGRLLVAIREFQDTVPSLELHVLHHRPVGGASYEPQAERLLPLDRAWWQSFKTQKWPTNQIPQIAAPTLSTFAALVSEYLYVSLFRACVESLASENASRLAGMQRAEKNIDALSAALTQRFHRLRQSSIDEELFDVVTGFEALAPKARRDGPASRA